MMTTEIKRAICGHQYSHVGPHRETEAEAIADAMPFATAGGKCRIARVLTSSKATDNKTVIRYQALALGRKKTAFLPTGVCNSFGVRQPSDLAKTRSAGIYVDRDGSWVRHETER